MRRSKDPEIICRDAAAEAWGIKIHTTLLETIMDSKANLNERGLREALGFVVSEIREGAANLMRTLDEARETAEERAEATTDA